MKNGSGIIKVRNMSKVYKIYDQPVDRLKESISLSKKKYHKDFCALNDISFTIEKGKTVGIIGKNGSGKSTLLKILAGVLNPTNGVVELYGTVAAILELGAGFNVEYSGLDNIYLNGTILGKTKKQIEEKIDDILKFADIGEFIYQPVKSYSSGMFARLAFAVAINVGSDILIVDEALAVGDMKFQAKCFRKFEELKENGTTILFVGHDVSSIRKFCDKAMWIDNGKLVNYGDTLSVTAEYMEFMNSDQELKKVVSESSDVVSEFAPSQLDPINRWGTQVGLITSVTVQNEYGDETNVIKYNETVRINLKFKMPEKVDHGNFSVAVSIKNTMGLDIIVFTTYDDDRKLMFTDKAEEIHVIFEFVNYLNDGEYVIVAALEDRSSIQPQYYDFVEGASYIRSVTDSQYFGIVHTPFRVFKKED